MLSTLEENTKEDWTMNKITEDTTPNLTYPYNRNEEAKPKEVEDHPQSVNDYLSPSTNFILRNIKYLTNKNRYPDLTVLEVSERGVLERKDTKDKVEYEITEGVSMIFFSTEGTTI